MPASIFIVTVLFFVALHEAVCDDDTPFGPPIPAANRTNGVSLEEEQIGKQVTRRQKGKPSNFEWPFRLLMLSTPGIKGKADVNS